MISELGAVQETENGSDDPENRFEFALADLDGALATWHSHPSGSSNLSIDDYRFFQSWPNISHFIISSHEVWCYEVREGLVYLADEEDDHSPRPSG